MNKRYAIALAVVSGLICSVVWADEPVKVISISAKQFDYSPSQINLKTGEPVLLKLTSEDRQHGFNMPSLKLRADLLPGQVSEIRFTPLKAGEIKFFCDVFCGEGHEGMMGKMTVRD